MKKLESGQALLIVVLVMVVVLTTALSVSLRSVTNLRTSTEEENSQRAFYAAEAGIEKALKTTDTGPLNRLRGSVGNEATIKEVKAADISGTQFLLAGGNPVEKDDGVDVWLSDYPSYANPKSPPTFSIHWGNVSDDCNATNKPAAIEIIVLSGSSTTPTARRYAFDSCSRNNNFTAPDVGSYSFSGKTFKYRTPLTAIPITNGLLARVVPLYTSTPIGVSTCDASNQCTTLPSQGRKIESVGTSGTTQRKVVVYQGYPKVPAELFQYSLFAPR